MVSMQELTCETLCKLRTAFEVLLSVADHGAAQVRNGEDHLFVVSFDML
jgi:hypothetical protein